MPTQTLHLWNGSRSPELYCLLRYEQSVKSQYPTRVLYCHDKAFPSNESGCANPLSFKNMCTAGSPFTLLFRAHSV